MPVTGKHVNLCVQFMAAMGPSLAIKDEVERLAARSILTAPDGALTKKVQVIEKVLEGCGSPFYCGEEPTVADFRLYLWLSLVRSGCVFNTCRFLTAGPLFCFLRKALP